MGGSVIRVIVFEEGDLFVAQCIEHDICVQARTIPILLDRLELTVEAEFATCEAHGQTPRDAIGPAPDYFGFLWSRRSVQLKRITELGPSDGRAYDLDIALAETTLVAA